MSLGKCQKCCLTWKRRRIAPPWREVFLSGRSEGHKETSRDSCQSKTPSPARHSHHTPARRRKRRGWKYEQITDQRKNDGRRVEKIISLFLEPKSWERYENIILKQNCPIHHHHQSVPSSLSTQDQPEVYLPLSHMPAVFPVWCPGISLVCWNRGSSSDLRRSRGPDSHLSPGGPSWADSPLPWLTNETPESQNTFQFILFI